MKILSFYLNNKIYGVNTSYVAELTRKASITPVPLCKKEIEGICNLRGRQIVVLNLKKVLKAEETGRASSSLIVLKPIKNVQDTFALLTNKAADVFEINSKEILPLPAGEGGANTRYILGVCKWEQNLITILAVDKIIEGITK